MFGSNKEMQLPIVDIAGGSFLQPKTEAETRLSMRFSKVRAPRQPILVILKFLLRRGFTKEIGRYGYTHL